MKFNLNPLESIVLIFVCLAIYIWTKYGRRIRRWLQEYFRRRGWKVSFLYSIIRLGSRQVIRAGLKALSFSGIVQTAFVERVNLTLRELIAPLSRRTWSISYDKQHLELHKYFMLGLLSFLPSTSITDNPHPRTK